MEMLFDIISGFVVGWCVGIYLSDIANDFIYNEKRFLRKITGFLMIVLISGSVLYQIWQRADRNIQIDKLKMQVTELKKDIVKMQDTTQLKVYLEVNDLYGDN
jgi:hypothetical protein